jgi:hypothetical protein
VLAKYGGVDLIDDYIDRVDEQFLRPLYLTRRSATLFPMSTHPLALYLGDCRARRGTGATTPETSLYPPLEALLTAVGHKLKPRVRCFMSLRNQGAGMPDGGLFTPDQIARGASEPPEGQNPSRGVIECKPPKDDVLAIADTRQVSTYWNRYNQVLVTNYREFVLIGRDDRGLPVRHEFYRLAADEPDFWRRDVAATVAEHGDRLLDFLERCLRRPAPLTDPKDVAWFLASYARDARGRVEHAGAHTALASVRKALEDALGLKVTDAKGEHFFQSTLVQTLFYGVFSAWVLWHRSHPNAAERFDWEKAPRYLHVPILRKLFRELSDTHDLDAWDNLTEVMGWAADALNRVDRNAFFAKFKDAEAVQYFYEPFLEAFDPDLRKQLGVWYTPPEIVKYMVGRVDQVLRSDFGRPDGLADPDVYVLDPCCGTGAYLVEVLNTIAHTLTERGEGATLAERLKQAAINRVFGFEILPAPFVVSHLQLGLFLQQHGTALDDRRQERAAVYLTNALTGWQPPTGARQRLMFPEMEQERDAADKVKQEIPILVVLGNPPYNGFAGLPVEEEKGLVEPYRTTKKAPKPQGQGLNDLYVRFFRVAERCITERHAKHGIVCYIANYSWLDGLSHTGLRERFLDEFDQIWIDSLNGDKYKTGKTTPEGKPDPSIFSTPQNREGIQVGTAVALFARTPKHKGPAKIRFRDFWGEAKREDLVASGQGLQPRRYAPVKPVNGLGLPFRPTQADDGYSKWPTIPDLLPVSFSGVQTKQDELLVDITRDRLVKRMSDYFDSSITNEELRRLHRGSLDGTHACEPLGTRDYLVRRGFLPKHIVRVGYRPFDIRWLYLEPETKLVGRPVPDYVKQVFAENRFLFTTGRTRKDQIEPPIVSRIVVDLNLMDSGARGVPLFLKNAKSLLLEVEGASATVPNLSPKSVDYLESVNSDPDDLFHHLVAILHSPVYRHDNFSGLKAGWPRIPLPASRADLVASAELGRLVAALLDPETPVAGVTAGRVRPELKSIAVATRAGGGQLTGADFAVTARWGITGQGGVTMPGPGKRPERPFTDAETSALGTAGIQCLGPDTLDVYLNDIAHWRNVPRRVWEYTLGGYQVLKKWLSYREQPILGRQLTVDEVGYVTAVARRIAALLLLGPDLDANYRRTKDNAYSWPI